MRARALDTIVKAAAWLVALSTLAALTTIIGYIVIEGAPSIAEAGLDYFTTAPSGIRMEGGVFPMIVASIYLTILSLAIAFPIGIGSAIYLSEYAKAGKFVEAVRFSSDLLSGVPSIVFGLFGLAFFVYFLQMGYSMLAGALTLLLMVLPTLLRTGEEAIRAVPASYREASLSLGASKWQTIKGVVLPTAAPGILTGVILSMGRAFGETAAVIYTAGSNPRTPILPLEGGRTLTVHLYYLATLGQYEDAVRVAAVLLFVVLFFNLLAGWLAERYRRRFG